MVHFLSGSIMVGDISAAADSGHVLAKLYIGLVPVPYVRYCTCTGLPVLAFPSMPKSNHCHSSTTIVPFQMKHQLFNQIIDRVQCPHSRVYRATPTSMRPGPDP